MTTLYQAKTSTKEDYTLKEEHCNLFNFLNMFISALKAIELYFLHILLIQTDNNPTGVKTDITQVRSLLVLELMTLQLFYNFQKHANSHGTDDLTSSKVVLYSESNQDMMLRSMEGLLEVSELFVHSAGIYIFFH